MVAVMAYTMLGERSPLKCLIGATVLIAASAVLAPRSRRSTSLRRLLVDYWAMALTMLVLVPQHLLGPSTTAHHHGGAIALGGLFVAVAVCAAWALARAVLALHQQDARDRASATTAILTAVGLALTLAFCG
jgi:hypothetical protein